MRNWLFILFFVSFIVPNLFAEQESEGVVNEQQTEEQNNAEQAEEPVKVVQSPRKLSPKELKKRERNTEKLARQIVKERFEGIEKQQKKQEKKEKQEKKKEKSKKKKKDTTSEEMPEDESQKEDSEELENEPDKQEVNNDEYEDNEISYEEEDFEIGIDSVLLAKRITELENERKNELEIKESKKNGDGSILLKVKVPNCYYLNSVVYKRGDFEFTYQLDFFIHYFEHRFHHQRKFYDIDDPHRKTAKLVMNLVGNTQYRRTDFNEVIDSIGILLGHSVEEPLDTIITELNLEYLATGEVKVKYKKKNQSKIYAKFKPSDTESNSLGNITFYTRNKKRVIEQLDASQYESYLSPPENAEADSTSEYSDINLLQDSLMTINDSLPPLLSIDNSAKTDVLPIESTPAGDSIPGKNIIEEVKQEAAGENLPEKQPEQKEATVPIPESVEETPENLQKKEDDSQDEEIE